MQRQSNFTDVRQLSVTIGGDALAHLCFHFVLAYLNWEWVTITYSETFEALVGGLQASMGELGAVPAEHRTDKPVGGHP